MAKSNKRKAKQADAKRAADASPDAARRSFLARMRTYAIGGAVVAGAGVWSAGYYRAYAAEHDLTRIGKGKPKVVQIHDPQCPLCATLQREARAAVEDMDTDALCFLVANIRTPKGRDFANAHGVGHVTLLLLDGDGQVVEVMEGVRRKEELKRRFEVLARA